MVHSHRLSATTSQILKKLEITLTPTRNTRFHHCDMPRRAPFTLLCQTAAKLARPLRFDLHTHTNASDGDFTPSQLVGQACNAGLAGLAITDHDTTFGLAEAREVAGSLTAKTITIVTGVEISTFHDGQRFHLLGYFFDEKCQLLQNGLASIRHHRRIRFQEYLDAFTIKNVRIPDHLLASLGNDNIALGRRHLAKLLVATGHSNTPHIAFLKHINPIQTTVSHSVPMTNVLHWIHDAGGLASLAHPPAETTLELLKGLQQIGLDAVEASYPSGSYTLSEDLRQWAHMLGLAVTAGSDYHGHSHVLGSRTITRDDLDNFQQRTSRINSAG